MNFTKEQQEHFVRMAMEQVEESIRNGGTPLGVVLVSPDSRSFLDLRYLSSPPHVLCAPAR